MIQIVIFPVTNLGHDSDIFRLFFISFIRKFLYDSIKLQL